MPTYEYRCPEGHDFERFFRSISAADPQVACPECGKIAERRMSAGAGLLFKGSGFYLTDYGKNAHRSSGSAPQKSEKSEGTSNSSSDSSSSSSTPAASSDAKPAAKSEAKAEAKPAATTPSKPKSDK
jgi:putative FmdB family regulatory protein